MEKDDTQYRLITSDYVSVGDFEGHPMLKVEPEGLRLLAAEAFHDVAFFLRPAHLKQVAAILDDPEASDNDKSVALTASRYGPAVTTANSFPTAFTTPIPRTTCAIPRRWRWICTRRKTPAPTFPPKLTWKRWRA